MIINKLTNENNRLKQCNYDEIDEKIIEHNEHVIYNILSFDLISINTEVVDFINYPYFTNYSNNYFD